MRRKQFSLAIVSVFVIIATIFTSFAGTITAFASGVGSPGGSGGNASSAPASAQLRHGDARDIVGYRFTTYSAAGVMVGHPSDIMLTHDSYVKNTFYGYINNDTNHYLVDKVNLSKAEKDSDTSSKKTYSSPMTLRKVEYSNGVYTTYYRNSSNGWTVADSGSDVGKKFVYYWDTIKSNSTLGFYRSWDNKMSYDTSVFFGKEGDDYAGWLNKKTDTSGTKDNVTGVKKLCGVSSISDDQYVFVEPIIMARVDDPSNGQTYYYAMTISEWGLFQCDATIQIYDDAVGDDTRNGWSIFPISPSGVNTGDWYLWICNYVSALHVVMLKNVVRHLSDNRGEENISKMIWIAIAFIVGAIILALLVTAFRGPITNWFNNTVNSWFNDANSPVSKAAASNLSA